MKHSSFLALALTLSLVAACGYVGHSSSQVIGPNTTPTGSGGNNNQNKPIAGELNFDYVRAHIIQSKCISCHQDDDFFASANGMRAEKLNISNHIAGITRPMPPPNKPQLTQCEKDILNQFLKENVPTSTETTMNDIPSCRQSNRAN